MLHHSENCLYEHQLIHEIENFTNQTFPSFRLFVFVCVWGVKGGGGMSVCGSWSQPGPLKDRRHSEPHRAMSPDPASWFEEPNFSLKLVWHAPSPLSARHTYFMRE